MNLLFHTTVVLCFGFFVFFLSACSPYKTIRFTNLQGLEIKIPASCTSWRDGCNIYCRTGAVEYITIETDNICIQANIIWPKCADTNQDAIEACAPYKINTDNNQ